MFPAHVAAVQKNDISGLKNIRAGAFPKQQVFHIGWRADKAVPDSHDRGKGEAPFCFWFRLKADVDFSGLQHFQGMNRRLAFNGNIYMGVLLHKAF